MTRTELDALASAYFDAVCAGDAERLRAIFADDVKWRVPQGAIEPYAGVHEGAERIIGMMLGATDGAFVAGSQVFEVRSTLIEGDLVCKETRMTAEAPDGRHYENDYTFFFVIRDGRIAEIREHVDTRYAANFFA